MRKTLILTCFIIATLVVFGMFISATTYIQLAVAIVTYPLLVYIAFVVFPRKHFSHHALPSSTIALESPLVAQKTESGRTESVGIADIDKRVFLKLIGGAGISLFLFSLISKKTEGLFFRGVQPIAPPVSGKLALEDLSGNKVNPAQSQPTDGYGIAEIDDSLISFYGFTNKDGAWYVMREDPDNGSFRYARGNSNFPDNWTNREKLNYDYFSNVF